MCGIAGIVAESAERFHPNLQCMMDALAHRGPDGEGLLFYPNCGLGHRRLAIVDIAGGAQPMLSRDGGIGIILNGEIYGFQDVRKTVAYPFHTTSDTEVLLALYDCYGQDMLARLPGMFAFALWDERKKLLFCARDRFGEKPFFYARLEEGGFIYASEIKALLASGLVSPKLDRGALRHYLQYMYVPSDRTIFENIHCLPPAHSLSFRDGIVTMQRYWELPPSEPAWSLPEASERFSELLAQAVKRQLVADVEVAAFLSGGLDSSTIVFEAARQKADLRTIAFGFRQGLDERPYAAAAAAMYGTTHMEMGGENLDIPSLLLRMADIYDEPFADSSNIPTYLIAQAAAKHVRVVLTGDGGDELLAGYEGWYQPLLTMQREQGRRWRHFIRCLLLKTCRKTGFGAAAGFDAAIQAHEAVLRFPGAAGAHRSHLFFQDSELDACGLPPCPRPCTPSLSGTVDDALRMDLMNYMPGDILVKTDRAAMANGLELRAPFLDAELASFLISLPLSLKMTETESKILLRHAYARHWPEALRGRSKQGFGAPVPQWLRQRDVRELCGHYFAPQRKLYSLLPGDFINNYRSAGTYQTWILLVLSLWLERYGQAMSA